jgi:sulfur relay (sulfurtransferase) complex TusBCD TusD component (DsrE family)
VENRKLGILLSTPPGHPHVETVISLSAAAVLKGVDVYLYLIDEGVKNLRDARILALAGQGMKYFVCAYGCQQHGVPTESLDPRVTLCGLVILSNIVDACDQFVSFN